MTTSWDKKMVFTEAYRLIPIKQEALRITEAKTYTAFKSGLCQQKNTFSAGNLTKKPALITALRLN
ncbi:MAG: hypothetical protein RRY29_06890 [Desulfovibrionaceae bacterium]